MKAIAYTTSNFELYDPTTREVIQEVPRVIEWTRFYESRTGAGQIKILASDLPDEADDAVFQEFLKEAESEDGDTVALAVAAYLSSFEEEEEEEEEEVKPARKKRAPRKAASDPAPKQDDQTKTQE